MPKESVYNKRREELLAEIKKVLRKNKNATFDYVAYWKKYFPNEPRVGSFKQTFDRLIVIARRDLGLPKRKNLKRVSRAITTPDSLLFGRGDSLFMTQKKAIVAHIKEVLGQNPNAVFNIPEIWRSYFPKEHKMGRFKQFFDKWERSVRKQMGLPARSKSLKQTGEVMYTLKGKPFVPMKFKNNESVRAGLPVQIEAFLRDNPKAQRVPTRSAAVYLGRVRPNELIEIHALRRAGKITPIEEQRRIANYKHRLAIVKTIKQNFVIKIRKKLKIKTKGKRGGRVW